MEAGEGHETDEGAGAGVGAGTGAGASIATAGRVLPRTNTALDVEEDTRGPAGSFCLAEDM